MSRCTAILLLVSLLSITINANQESGFLREFFEKFPHLLHPKSEAYYRALAQILARRKGSHFEDLITTTQSTTTTTTIGTTNAIKRSFTTTANSPKLKEKDDIWFGSTPAPMYRGYVTNSYKFRANKKQPSLKFHAADPSPPTLKFIEPHRLVGATKHLGKSTTAKPTLQPLYYSTSLKKPYEIIKEELNEPAYMTDPHFSLDFKKEHPYENKEPIVKPQEVKSLKPKIPELKPLETTTEVYDYSYLYENYDLQDYQDYYDNYLAHPDPSEVSSLPPRPPVKQISTEPPAQVTTTPIYYSSTTSSQPPPVRVKTKKPSFAQFKHNYYKKPVKSHVTSVPAPPPRKPIITAVTTTTPAPLVVPSSHFGNFDHFEIQKIQPGVNEFIDLTLKAQKPAKELAFGYFELPHHEISTPEPYLPPTTTKPYIPVFTTKYPKLYHKANAGNYNPYGYHVHNTTPKPFKTYNIPTHQPYYNPQPEEYFYPEPEPHKEIYSSSPLPYVSTPVPTTTHDPYFKPGFEFENHLVKPTIQPYQEEYLYAPVDPYVPKHHHLGHKHKYVTHKHLNYPYGHGFDEYGFMAEPGDKIQKHILHFNDPWLPRGPEVKVTPSPPKYQPYKQYDLSTYYNYDGSSDNHHHDDLAFYKHEHAKRKIPIDLGREKGLKTVQNAFDNLDYLDDYGDEPYFQPSKPRFPDIFDIPPSHYGTNFKTTQKPKVIKTIKTTKKPMVFHHSTIRPTLQDLVKPLITTIGSTTTTKKPFKLKFKPKGKVISTKRPFMLKPTQTPKPSILSTIMPKIPILDQIPSFIDEQGGKLTNFVTGLLGNSKSDQQPSLKMDRKSLLSTGGHNELSQLEQIKLLLKENRDRPLL